MITDVFVVYTDDSQIKKIETPCDKSELIEFIVKTYKTNEKDIYSLGINDNEHIAGSSPYSYMNDDLAQCTNYINIREKYNDKITCQIRLYEYGMKHIGILYSCKSYMMYSGSISECRVDMSKLENVNN